MDGQDGQDEESADFRFQISNLYHVSPTNPAYPVHPCKFPPKPAGRGLACPYSFGNVL
jgi:hypothetical protein